MSLIAYYVRRFLAFAEDLLGGVSDNKKGAVTMTAPYPNPQQGSDNDHYCASAHAADGNRCSGCFLQVSRRLLRGLRNNLGCQNNPRTASHKFVKRRSRELQVYSYLRGYTIRTK